MKGSIIETSISGSVCLHKGQCNDRTGAGYTEPRVVNLSNQGTNEER